MQKGRKYFTPSDSIKMYAVGVGVFILVSLIAGMFLLLSSTEEVTNQQSLWVGTAMGTLSLFAASMLFCGRKNANILTAAALNKPPRLKDCAIGILFVVGLIFMLLPVAIMFTDALGVSDTDLGFDPYENPLSIVLSVLCVCVFAGVCEEVFMRGIVTRGFSRKGLPFACLMSGLLFMLLHMNPAQTVYQFALGAALGFIALWGGNTWVCVILHFVNNAFTLIMGGVMSEEAQAWWFIDNWGASCAVGFVVCVVAACLYVKNVPNVYNKHSELQLKQEEIDSQPLASDLCYEPEKELATLDKIGVIDYVVFALTIVLCAVMWLLNLVPGAAA